MTDLPLDPDSGHPDRPRSAIDFGEGAWLAKGDCRFTFGRSSGPGGQHVNKVNTRAELRVRLDAVQGLSDRALARLRTMAGRRVNAEDELVIVADESRSQIDNRKACIARLQDLVGRALVDPVPRRKTKPTRGSKERRLKAKRVSSERKSNRRWRPE